MIELSYTEQLRDYVLWAKKMGYKFHLTTPEGTEISGPLKDAITNGDIIHLVQ